MNLDAIPANGHLAADRADASNRHRGASIAASRQRGWGIPLSIAIHGGVLIALWLAAHGTLPKPTAPRSIEITLAPPPAPLPAAQPVVPAPQAAPAPRAQPRAPRQHAVRAVPPAPVLSTPTAAPAQETAPAPVAPAPPVAAAPPAPPAPPAPRVIGNAGMPSDYVNTVFSRINAHVRYPASARRAAIEGTVQYTLTLSPAGELLNVSIKSSGDESLDAAALDSIHAAAPFGRLPDLGGTTYRLTGAIAFALR